ncbi:glycolipid 2-alpha-mannosyltransferase [Colletotrichum asianum]
MSSDELPLALRRTRRSAAGAPSAASAPVPSPLATPHRASKRKVRFSDPGPVSTPRTTTRLSSTGLTPMIRRTTLNKGTPSTSRRHSAPVSRTPSGSGATPSSDLPHSGEVHFLPLRQVLDGRVQRRIRRNGLSEEMNTITAEKRRRAQETKAEIDGLRAQLKEKDAEIYELQNATIVIDMERIWGLEREVETLKEQLSNRSGVRGQSCYDWTLAARGPYVDDYMETDTIEAESVAGERMLADETAFGDATMVEFVCSTPTRVRSSFLTPPLTSPVAEGPMTPSSHRGSVAPPSHCNAGVQTSFRDTEKDSLQEELTSLRNEMSKLTNTLESYTSLTTRLSDQLSAFTPSATGDSEPLQTIEEQVTHLLRTVSDRTAALLDLNSSLSDLGFPGSDASEIITSLAASLRTARLELEYLTPGEITLPLSSHGAEVLDLLLTRLRDLAKRGKEDEAAIDEYHQLELSLRQQLGARVAAMDSLNEDLARAKAQLAQKDAAAAELRVSVDRLKGAVNGYIRDVMELEGVIGKMEGENRDAMATKDAQIEVGRRVLRSKEDVIAQLEGKLADAVAQTKAFRRRLDESEEGRVREVASVNRRSGQALAVRDARVAELREEVGRVNDSLRAAHESIKNLRIEKKGLEGKMAEERVGAKKVIDQMKAELERVVSMSREFLADEVEESTTPTSTPPRAAGRTPKKVMEPAAGVSKSPLAGGTVVRQGLLSGELVRRVSGRKRRKYDSGLGFLDEDEVDA